MTRDTFVTIVNEIVKQLQKENKLSKSFSVMFTEPVLINLSFDFITKLIDSLANEFNDDKEDNYNMIDWWLWDSPSAVDGLNKEYAWVEYDGKRFTLYDASELYDFLKYKMDNQ